MAIGVDYQKFMESNPKRLQPYVKAYKLKRKMDDEQAWLQGQYFYNALQVSLSHFASKNSTAKYMEKPILQDIDLVDQDRPTNEKESKENCAIIEMKQRIKLLEQQGLPQSPI